VTAPAGSASPAAKTAPTTITIVIPPGRNGSSSVRRTAYISPSTQSMTITAGGIITTANLTPTSPGCVAGTSVTCTVTANAPVGTSVPILVTIYSGTNASGSKLATQQVTATVTAGGPNNVNLTLNGIVDHVALSATTVRVPTGTPTSLPVTVNVYDAQNNIIVGPGTFSDVNGDALTVALSDSDTSGDTTLVPSSITLPATSVVLNYNGGSITTATLSAAITGGTIAGSVTPATVSFGLPRGTIVEYPIPTTGNFPTWIVSGPDGNLWFLESNDNHLDSITPAAPNTVTDYTIATFFAGYTGTYLTVGPDNNLWMTAEGTSPDLIIKGTLPGPPAFTDYNPGATFDGIQGIVTGPDHNLWFTEQNTSQIGTFNIGSSTGSVFGTTLTAGSFPKSIVSGPNGNLWFTENSADKIGSMTTSGALVGEYSIPTAASDPNHITVGPDDNLWFTEQSGNKIGSMTTSGAIVGEYPIPTSASFPVSITAGPDGDLWFTEYFGNKIGVITPTGSITEYAVPTVNGDPYGIVTGPDGNLWFIEQRGDKVGRISP
jgi:streptogramin lyase